MRKFNGAESYWITKGLELVKAEAMKEIKSVEDKGKNPIMTQGYVSQALEQIQDKVKDMTLKSHRK
jgi:hypothetical protein